VRSFDGAGAVAPGAGNGRVKVEAVTLTELAAALEAFEGCALKATAKNLCLFRGAEKARVMVIGEAPGRDEDLEGRPFAGPPGALLDRMLSAIALSEADVHLTNLVYWRPPGNRKPTAQEVAACAPFLARQIELVAPQIVVAAGDAAARQILATGDGIMKARGKWREIEIAGRKIKAIAILDPAYVLKAPASKRQVWKDLLMISRGLS
ncbi:MAG: uracil-DNA glycosylase, partial [Hyphomicrobiaceae bacterium]